MATEIKTKQGNRIDISIFNKAQQKAIIIENKIYHHLDNDLSDYWSHYNYPDTNKIGILLTLKPHGIPTEVAGKFVNITHLEWKERILSYKTKAGLDLGQVLETLTIKNSIDNRVHY